MKTKFCQFDWLHFIYIRLNPVFFYLQQKCKTFPKYRYISRAWPKTKSPWVRPTFPSCFRRVFTFAPDYVCGIPFLLNFPMDGKIRFASRIFGRRKKIFLIKTQTLKETLCCYTSFGFNSSFYCALAYFAQGEMYNCKTRDSLYEEYHKDKGSRFTFDTI